MLMYSLLYDPFPSLVLTQSKYRKMLEGFDLCFSAFKVLLCKILVKKTKYKPPQMDWRRIPQTKLWYIVMLIHYFERFFYYRKIQCRTSTILNIFPRLVKNFSGSYTNAHFKRFINYNSYRMVYTYSNKTNKIRVNGQKHTFSRVSHPNYQLFSITSVLKHTKPSIAPFSTNSLGVKHTKKAIVQVYYCVWPLTLHNSTYKLQYPYDKYFILAPNYSCPTKEKGYLTLLDI